MSFYETLCTLRLRAADLETYWPLLHGASWSEWRFRHTYAHISTSGTKWILEEQQYVECNGRRLGR